MNRWVIAVLLASCWLAAGQSWAQGPARYQPARPTVSPYLNLFRRDIGPLPNYHLLVRPQFQQQAINQQQQAAIEQNRTAVRDLGQNVLQIISPTAPPTGTGSGFMNYSHYYQGISR